MTVCFQLVPFRHSEPFTTEPKPCVAVASRRLAIVVDGTKLVDRLGERSAVPVEVVAFGHESTRGRLEALGATVDLRCGPDGSPFCTDSGNRILDCMFGAITEPATLEEQIGRIVGVIECGLFVGLTDVVFIGDSMGVTRLERSPRPLPALHG